MELSFRKVEGLGNDFLLVDRTASTVAEVQSELERLSPLAPQLCDRRTGVGADGLLIVGPPGEDRDGSMRVINFDGSRPEMCGNGLRCVAQHLAQHLDRSTLRIETDAGSKLCHVAKLATPRFEGRAEVEVEVDMGAGVDEGSRETHWGLFRAVSMGNPHAIAFVQSDPEGVCRRDGPQVECDPLFPARTNVEFAQLTAQGATLWVWERGCGVTQACGTGACATAFAAVRADLWPADKPMAIDLPGGRLWITVPSDSDSGVRMRGPASVVFDGRVRC